MMRILRRTALRRATVASATAGIALGLVAAPAAADPDRQAIRVKGPTYTYAKAYAKVKTLIGVREAHGGTFVHLYVSGFPKSAAGKVFGTHVHKNKCGRKPADAGPHYVWPEAPPGAPLGAKEIWLDVKIRKDGRGHASAVVPWQIRAGDANSVVVHAKPTDPDTGDAGARLLCTTVPFGQ